MTFKAIMISLLGPCLLNILFCIPDFFYISDPVMASGEDSFFNSDEVLNLELASHFSEIRADTAKDPKSHEGILTYLASDGKTKKFSVKVRARGDFRRNPDICNFPPLLINFRKKEVKNTIFDDQDKLKMVTPCQREEDVIEEYMIYKMYNQVTDLSFKVRLVKIKYYDTVRGEEVFERHSFFIEDEDQMAERNNFLLRKGFLTPFDLDRENFMKMSVFEYLIGNKDWFITSNRNILILRSEESLFPLYAVPFDFDFAGLIDASYTKPRNVPEKYLSKRRIYKGLCYTEDEFNRVFEFYRNLRPVFETIINSQEFISRATRRENISYLESFYTTIEDRESVKREFLDVCETRKMYNLPDL